MHKILGHATVKAITYNCKPNWEQSSAPECDVPEVCAAQEESPDRVHVHVPVLAEECEPPTGNQTLVGANKVEGCT